jgi:4-hydroxybenzoate polyprenyltransferase
MEQQLPVLIPGADVRNIAVRRRVKSRSLVKVARPHQWIKNLFVFAPLLFGGKLTDINAVIHAIFAFLAFCTLASAVYIFNDWLDLEDDRSHPEKKNRPISSGDLSPALALSVAVLLLGIAASFSYVVGPMFMAIAAFYVLLMLGYCLVLKRRIVLDCMTIAVGFVLRVVAGAVAVSVVPTHWLIACTFLLALFLAFTKRRQELLSLSEDAPGHRLVLGTYSVKYLEQANTILIGAALVSYALYTVAPETVEKFGTDALIYGTAFVLYGMFRYLALINDQTKGGNPSRLLLSDVPLVVTIVCWAAYNAIIIYRSSLVLLWENFRS